MALHHKDYEKMTTAELEAIVIADFEGSEVFPVDDMLALLSVLSARTETKYDVKQKFKEFCEHYLDA